MKRRTLLVTGALAAGACLAPGGPADRPVGDLGRLGASRRLGCTAERHDVRSHAAHLGAGVILSNVRLDRKEVLIPLPEGGFQPSGLRKFGAVIGDHAEIGCNSVINPGSLIGPNTLLYPGTQWRGILPANTLLMCAGLILTGYQLAGFFLEGSA